MQHLSKHFNQEHWRFSKILQTIRSRLFVTVALDICSSQWEIFCWRRALSVVYKRGGVAGSDRQENTGAVIKYVIKIKYCVSFKHINNGE